MSDINLHWNVKSSGLKVINQISVVLMNAWNASTSLDETIVVEAFSNLQSSQLTISRSLGPTFCCWVSYLPKRNTHSNLQNTFTNHKILLYQYLHKSKIEPLSTIFLFPRTRRWMYSIFLLFDWRVMFGFLPTLDS